MYVSIFYVAALLFCITNLSARENLSHLESIQKKIFDRKKVLEFRQTKKKLLNTQLRHQKKNIDQITVQMQNTKSEIKQLEEDISRINVLINNKKKQQTIQKDMFSKQLLIAFMNGRYNKEQCICSIEDFQRRERLLIYFSYFNQVRQNSISVLKKTRNELTKKKFALIEKKRQKTMVLNKKLVQKQKLNLVRTIRQKTLIEITAVLKEDQKRLLELNQNANRLRDKITDAKRSIRGHSEREVRKVTEELNKEKKARKSGVSYKPTSEDLFLMARTGGLGRHAYQAIWPVRGLTLHRFGEPLQGELFWKGMVIETKEGSEVKAIADGRVLLADWLQGYGWVVVIDHGKSDMSVYGYNQNALVRVGTTVRTGQPIALVGTNDHQSSPALYFEIRHQGQVVNPLLWLRK